MVRIDADQEFIVFHVYLLPLVLHQQVITGHHCLLTSPSACLTLAEYDYLMLSYPTEDHTYQDYMYLMAYHYDHIMMTVE